MFLIFFWSDKINSYCITFLLVFQFNVCFVEICNWKFRLSFPHRSFMCKCVKIHSSTIEKRNPSIQLPKRSRFTKSFPLKMKKKSKQIWVWFFFQKKKNGFTTEKIYVKLQIKRSLHVNPIIYWCVREWVRLCVLRIAIVWTLYVCAFIYFTP